jgi:hypothetical protein
MVCDLRTPHHHFQLLEQLRPFPESREGSRPGAVGDIMSESMGGIISGCPGTSSESAPHARLFLPGDLHRGKTRSSLLSRSRLSPPGEHHACRYPITARDLGHFRARHFVILRPASPALNPVQNLNPHRLMTLKLDLRSHPSRDIPLKQTVLIGRVLNSVSFNNSSRSRPLPGIGSYARERQQNIQPIVEFVK